MGFLHEGHLTLARRARRENGLVVASIFVNPLQFGPAEDFDAYPRAPRRDHALLAREGVDLCYEPRTEAVYAPDFSTLVIVGDLDEPLCGRFRPGTSSAWLRWWRSSSTPSSRTGSISGPRTGSSRAWSPAWSATWSCP